MAGKNPKPSEADSKKPPKFYAVAIGRTPGIYTEWTEAQKAFQGWKGVKQRAFKTRAEAVDFIRAHGDEAGLKSIENESEEPAAKRTKIINDGAMAIFTDGSSLSGGTARARAGVGVWFGDKDPRFVSHDCPFRTALIPPSRTAS